MHQKTIAVSTMPVQTGQVVIVQPQQSRLNVPVIRAHGITQIVLGALTVILGIVSVVVLNRDYWVNRSVSGIWFGVWILVTGIIGYLSSRKPESKCLNGTNMGFNIFCTFVSFFVFISFAIALGYFNNCTEYLKYYCQNKAAGTAIYALLTSLMIAELIVSICCCYGYRSCGTQTTAVIVQQPAGYTVATTGHTVITTNTGYPQTALYSGTAIPYSTGDPAYQSYPQQSQMTHSGMMAAQTNTAYSADQYA